MSHLKISNTLLLLLLHIEVITSSMFHTRRSGTDNVVQYSNNFIAGIKEERPAMYVWHNTVARSCNHCLQWKSSKYYIFWMCVCSLSYPACNAHEPYCHQWPARLYNIFFPHYLINGTIIEYKVCVLIFSTPFVWNISHSKKKCVRYDKKRILVFM